MDLFVQYKVDSAFLGQQVAVMLNSLQMERIWLDCMECHWLNSLIGFVENN